jgi:hypothetical protein
MTSLARRLVSLAALVLSACGGGGGGGGGSDGPTPARHEVILLFVSGHAFDSDPAYLRFDAGPDLEEGLAGAGWDVGSAHYVDGAGGSEGFGGYSALVADLEFVRDEWAPLGTRVIVVAHSHGGVWAHAAVRDVPGLSVLAFVDLDSSSFAWALSGHTTEDDAIGGDPSDVYDIGVLAMPPAYPLVPSEDSDTYDVEDVVFSNVASAFEVRSGDSPLGGEWFDEKWNVRLNGTTTGLAWYFSDSTHQEVHEAGGTTLGVVESWLEDRLAE